MMRVSGALPQILPSTCSPLVPRNGIVHLSTPWDSNLEKKSQALATELVSYYKWFFYTYVNPEKLIFSHNVCMQRRSCLNLETTSPSTNSTIAICHPRASIFFCFLSKKINGVNQKDKGKDVQQKGGQGNKNKPKLKQKYEQIEA